MRILLAVTALLMATHMAEAQPKTGAGSLMNSGSSASVSIEKSNAKAKAAAKAAASEAAKAAAEKVAKEAAKKTGKKILINAVKLNPYMQVAIGVLKPVQLAPD